MTQVAEFGNVRHSVIGQAIPDKVGPIACRGILILGHFCFQLGGAGLGKVVIKFPCKIDRFWGGLGQFRMRVCCSLVGVGFSSFLEGGGFPI